MSVGQNVLVRAEGAVTHLVLNRPAMMNAFDGGLIREFLEALSAVEADRNCRLVLVRGEGRVFQAGADIAELNRMTPLELLDWNEGIVRIGAGLERLPPPSIAVMHGAALGGGLELAMACTLRVAEEGCKIGLPEVKLGLIPGAGGTQRLPRLIGKTRAAWLILSGETISAEQALDLGLVNRVAPPGKGLEVALEMSQRILSNAPVAVRMAKDAMEIGLGLPLNEANQYAQKNCALCFSTEDLKEGTQAFLDKRAACFKGR
ncbi:MAG: enoyl-CoA hydratase/isomerase family protein [Proteobacteria bacterium]|nr:enoyl-CoA hydratase/isomerase family protein [Pseudomonadota bacterium]MBU1452079.1 enoyl-CoA hydratase/isomerase family protein [Pseudomonadota bacterium]MBU2467276.1 enoyl-CoA hydratase/isomerase family protein [Pseudomonadota bacterium]MBU2517361.1 enoyl-CoA hydratase/isomerase family protein [Pseudomonadota bacterium]